MFVVVDIRSDDLKAVLTKRRETHALFAKPAPAGLPPPETKPAVSPRMRLEPNPTYYLRMARSYAFIERALIEALGR